MKSIMKRAWEIARRAVFQFGGRAYQYIAEALRMAWKEAKGPTLDVLERIDELTDKGFRRWQKNGMDRMYINASSLGLVCTFYKTGNISSAQFDGEKISNHRAYGLRAAKTYIDLVHKRLVSDEAMLAAAAAELIGATYSYGDKIIRL